MRQNPGADPSCQWSQQLLLEDRSGLNARITRLVANGNDLTSRIQPLFGTSYLAAFGSLQASVCWPAGTSPSNIAYEIDGVDQTGSPVLATSTSTLSSAAASPGALSASPHSVSLTAANPSSTLNLSADGADWTVTTFPANQSTKWLSVSPASGTGSRPITVSATPSGLATGAYSATLVFQAANALPQFIEVPVVLNVGSSSTISIAGLSNAASFQQNYAPGMAMSIFGAQLAPSIQPASNTPLPVNLAGVSATVNGVAAPLYYVSPTQLNIQIPYETGAGPAVLGVTNNGQLASTVFTVTPSAPGIFTDASHNLIPSSRGNRGDRLSLFLTGDGDVSPPLPSGSSPFSATPLSFLPQSGLPITVSVGGVAAQIAFTGIPPGLVGTTQINFVIPQNAPTGAQRVVVSVGGVPSQPANLQIAP